MEQYNRHIKVSHRVVFPLELRLFNTVSTFPKKLIKIQHFGSNFISELKNLMYASSYSIFQSDDAVNPDRMYDLVAVVIHCGSGPNRGHCKYLNCRKFNLQICLLAFRISVRMKLTHLYDIMLFFRYFNRQIMWILVNI